MRRVIQMIKKGKFQTPKLLLLWKLKKLLTAPKENQFEPSYGEKVALVAR